MHSKKHWCLTQSKLTVGLRTQGQAQWVGFPIAGMFREEQMGVMWRLSHWGNSWVSASVSRSHPTPGWIAKPSNMAPVWACAGVGISGTMAAQLSSLVQCSQTSFAGPAYPASWLQSKQKPEGGRRLALPPSPAARRAIATVLLLLEVILPLCPLPSPCLALCLLGAPPLSSPPSPNLISLNSCENDFLQKQALLYLQWGYFPINSSSDENNWSQKGIESTKPAEHHSLA